MGAYLSEPIVEKVSCDEASDKVKLSYGNIRTYEKQKYLLKALLLYLFVTIPIGASGMQGWRVSQEVSQLLQISTSVANNITMCLVLLCLILFDFRMPTTAYLNLMMTHPCLQYMMDMGGMKLPPIVPNTFQSS